MNRNEFSIIYALVTITIVAVVILWRYRQSKELLSAAPIKAEVIALEKDVDIILSVQVRLNANKIASVVNVPIDPMYDKTEYEIGSYINVWASKENPSLVFFNQPNILKVLTKVSAPALILLFLLWAPLAYIYHDIINM
jgi:hypothetical protein